MSKEAMKLALEALKELVAQTESGLFAVRHDHVAMQDARQAITALREALAEQPAQQEPVAYLCENAVGHKYFRWKKPSGTYKPIALYTPPQPAQRPWVGLTDGVMCDIAIEHGLMSIDWIDFARAIEAKLKEKNT